MSALIYRRDPDGRLRGYYSHTNMGRPIFTSRGRASEFSGATLMSVMRQLAQLQPAAQFGTVRPGQLLPRVKKARA